MSSVDAVQGSAALQLIQAALAESQTNASYAAAVAATVQDAQNQQGQAAVALIQSATESLVDLRA